MSRRPKCLTRLHCSNLIEHHVSSVKVTQSLFNKSGKHRSMKTFHVLIAVHLVLAACDVLKAVRHFGKHKEVCKLFTTTVAVKVVGYQTRYVKLNTCAGTCRSEQTYNSKSCECCSPIKKKPVNVELLCVKPGTKGPAYRYRHKVHEHEICSCLRCLDH